MFIRKKQANGDVYYAVVENYRQDGKVRQRQIVALWRHSTIEEAIRAQKDRLTTFGFVMKLYGTGSADSLKEEYTRLELLQKCQEKMRSDKEPPRDPSLALQEDQERQQQVIQDLIARLSCKQ